MLRKFYPAATLRSCPLLRHLHHCSKGQILRPMFKINTCIKNLVMFDFLPMIIRLNNTPSLKLPSNVILAVNTPHFSN